MNEIRNTKENPITTEMKEVIKEMYFPKSNDAEFAAFLFDAQAKGLDPLQKEIIPIQFKGKTTTVVSRDGYVKKAKENPNFLGYRSQPIYSNDEFTYEESNDGFKYEFKTNGFGDRGELVGAFCHVKMAGDIEDTFSLVSYKEVRQNTPVWKSNPTFMTQKVAEVRALKPVCNLSGICSDVELGTNIIHDDGTEDEIDSETKQEINEELQEPKQNRITTQEEVNQHFLSYQKEEGFTKQEILQELEKLHENKKITSEYYRSFYFFTGNSILTLKNQRIRKIIEKRLLIK